MNKRGIMQKETLKDMVGDHILPLATPEQLTDHADNTDNTLESQREYLKRLVTERSGNPLEEVDAIQTINGLDENLLCPFIDSYIANG